MAAETKPDSLPLLWLLGSNAISLLGSSITTIALPWYVLQSTGSAAQAGLVGAVSVMPALVAGIIGGSLVDRLGAKRVALAEDVSSAVAVALIPLLHQKVGLSFWSLLVLVFAASLLNVPGETARYALLPELAARAGWRLERANAAFQGNGYAAALLGPAVAGLLIALVGVTSVLWIDAASFLISAVIVSIAVPNRRAASEKSAPGGALRELFAGIRFLAHDRLLRALAIGLACGNLFGLGALFAVMLPVYATDAFGSAAVLGVLVAAQGAGQLIGAGAFAMVGHRLPRRLVWSMGFLLNPLRFGMLAVALPLPVLLVVLVGAGVVSGAFTPLLVTVLHERVPASLHGRVFAVFAAMGSIAVPLGIALSGMLVERWGLQLTAAGLAAISSLVGLAMLRSGALTSPAIAEYGVGT